MKFTIILILNIVEFMFLSFSIIPARRFPTMTSPKTTLPRQRTTAKAPENPALSKQTKATTRGAAVRSIHLEDATVKLVSAFESALQEPARVTPELRWKMICDAAYHRAEHRSFAAGDPVQDWLEAEEEIDRRLNGARGAAQES
jgi:hypothetical protein